MADGRPILVREIFIFIITNLLYRKKLIYISVVSTGSEGINAHISITFNHLLTLISTSGQGLKVITRTKKRIYCEYHT